MSDQEWDADPNAGTDLEGWEGDPAEAPGNLGRIDRRSLLQMSVVLMGAESAPHNVSPVGGIAEALAELLEKSDPSTLKLDDLELAVNHFARTFDDHEFRILNEKLTSYLRTVLKLLKKPTSYRTRGALCLHGSRLAGMLGLVTHMEGKVGESLTHYRNAFLLAEEIGDRPFMSWVMAERAAICWSVGNPATVLPMTDGFLGHAGGATLANILSNRALAASRMADQSGAISLIGLAEAAADAIPSEQNSDLPGRPIWGFSPSSTMTNTAIAWLHLDNPQRALVAARQSVERLGNHALQRHTAHARIIEATARVRLGDPEEACRIATEVIGSAPQDVFIIAGQSVDLLRSLDKYDSHQDVRQLRETIAHFIDDRTR